MESPLHRLIYQTKKNKWSEKNQRAKRNEGCFVYMFISITGHWAKIRDLSWLAITYLHMYISKRPRGSRIDTTIVTTSISRKFFGRTSKSEEHSACLYAYTSPPPTVNLRGHVHCCTIFMGLASPRSVFAILSSFWKKAELVVGIILAGHRGRWTSCDVQAGLWHCNHSKWVLTAITVGKTPDLLRKTLKRQAVLWQFTGNARRNLKTVIDS